MRRASPIVPTAGEVRIGTAGWSLPRDAQPRFPAEGSHLQRYAAKFGAVEINSSFHRPHRPSTYARWAESVPAEVRFSVKLPKAITHVRRLRETEDALDVFFAEAGALGERLGCLLVQLPPSLEFDMETAEGFFAALRERFGGGVACEPRHASWFATAPDALLARMRVARVAADPAPVRAAAEPGGWDGLVYRRLHGSPRVYYSSYDDDFIARLAGRLREDAESGAEAWCIFDNTASGAATANALDLLDRFS